MKRTVRLIQDAETGGKFYIYTARPGFEHNARMLVDIPEDMVLAVAYPTLEDYLTQPITRVEGAMVTIDSCRCEPREGDEGIIEEFQKEVYESRDLIDMCLSKLQLKIDEGKTLFLGCDFDLFKYSMIDLAVSGSFGYVDLNGVKTIETVAHEFGSLNIRNGRKRYNIPLEQQRKFLYRFRNKQSLEKIKKVEGPFLIREIFNDLQDANKDNCTYSCLEACKENLSDKWLGFLKLYRECITAAMSGTNPADYDLSGKQWEESQLCKAITHAFIRLEESGKYRFD